MDLVTFTVIIDDIVYPDGHTCMASLGGGGPQTAFGAKIWVDNAINIGIASGIGSDFPLPCKRWLEDMGIDLSGLLMWSSPTLRAWQVLQGIMLFLHILPLTAMAIIFWQILELDGLRTQVWRIAMGDEVLDMLRPPLSSLPMTYRSSVASSQFTQSPQTMTMLSMSLCSRYPTTLSPNWSPSQIDNFRLKLCEQGCTVAEYEGVPPPQLSNWTKQAQMRLDMLRPYAKKLLLPM